MKRKLVFFAAILLTSVSLTFGFDLTNLYTGVDKTGGVGNTPDGKDDNYSLKDGTAWVTKVEPSWFKKQPEMGLGKWIAPVADSAATGVPAKTLFIYTVSFNIPDSINLSTFIISGQWASDNQSKIFLNGNPNPIGQIDGPGFNKLQNFTLSGLLASNTLKFEVYNAGGSDNPSGLLVTNLTAIPETSTLAALALSIGLVGYGSLRRRKKPDVKSA